MFSLIQKYMICISSIKFKTRKHSSRNRTGRFSDFGGSLQRPPPNRDPPGQRIPQTETPPLEGTWDQAARQEVTLYRDPICEQNDLQTGVKPLPCPKLCLWAVMIYCRLA